MREITILGFGLVAALALTGTSAHAQTLNATYFTLGETDPDVASAPQGTFSDWVLPDLGPNGLPVFNPSASGFSPTDPSLKDLDSAGEITWWSPALNTNVTETSTGTVNLPFSNPNFFPPNGTGSNDANGLQTAIFSGTLNVPTSEQITFSVGADDDAFVYLDGVNVCDLGGIHGDSPGMCTTSTIDAGDHTLELFYADIEQTGAALTFSVETEGVTTTATSVPEPASMALLGGGMIGLGWLRRRKSA